MRSSIVEFDFSFGQCALTLRSPTAEVRIENHWLNGRFTHLVKAVDLLTDGVESTGCRWQGAVIEGHFVDFVTDPGAGVSVAVHAFRYPEGTTYAEIWSAERGEVVFAAHYPFSDFVVAFAAALRQVRATAVDASGMINEYPWPFPQSIFERIETRAARMASERQLLRHRWAAGSGRFEHSAGFGLGD